MQTQSLNQLLSSVTAKVDAEAKAKAQDKPQPTYFERMLPGLRDGSIHAAYDRARKVGEARADDFMQAVRSPVHRSHNTSVESYYKNFGGDYSNVVSAYISAASDELGAPDPEDCKQDMAHEDRITKQYRPTGNMSREDLAFYGILTDELKKSRDAKGYGKGKCFDNEVIAQWKHKYHR